MENEVFPLVEGTCSVDCTTLSEETRGREECASLCLRIPPLSDPAQVVPAEGQENGQRGEEEEEKEPEAETPLPPQVSVEAALPPPAEHEVKKGGYSMHLPNSQSTVDSF